MSAPNVSNIYRSPGRLVKNPTSLTSAYPFGGTELGIARDMAFKPMIATRKLIAEEFKSPVEVILTGTQAVMTGVMRTWDNSMMSTLFPEVTTSSAGDVGIVDTVAGARPGYPLTRKACVLLFSPLAVDLHKSILIYNAVPIVDEAFEMRLSLAEEFGLPFAFQAIPDAYGRSYAIDLRANLSL